ARISCSMTPTPTPRISRPPLRTSSVAAAFASRTGLWYGSTSTEVPRRPRRDEAQERQRLVVRLAADPVEDVAHVEDVIVNPDRVDAELFRPAREIDE